MGWKKKKHAYEIKYCGCGAKFAVQRPVVIFGITVEKARGYWCWKCDTLRK